MAGEQPAPGIGISAGFDIGSDGYGDEMNASLVRLSMMANCRVASRVTSLPGSPSNGDMYIVPTGDAQGDHIAGYHKSTWYYVPPQEGMRVYVRDTDEVVEYSGSAWVVQTASSEAPDRIWDNENSDISLVIGDFDGRTVKAINSTPDRNVTIPSGLTPTKTATVFREGEGEVTLVAGSGVTLLSKDNNLVLGGRYTAVVIVPTDTADEYALLGDLVAPA